jgi:hypothetical protein
MKGGKEERKKEDDDDDGGSKRPALLSSFLRPPSFLLRWPLPDSETNQRLTTCHRPLFEVQSIVHADL